jgi:hypothetical protein
MAAKSGTNDGPAQHPREQDTTTPSWWTTLILCTPYDIARMTYGWLQKGCACESALARVSTKSRGKMCLRCLSAGMIACCFIHESIQPSVHPDISSVVCVRVVRDLG